MTANDFQLEAMKTASGMEGGDDMDLLLLMGLMGMNGESGEAIDLLKKSMFQGHEMDKRHLALELGDVAYYVAVAAFGLGYTFDDILLMSVEKVRAGTRTGLTRSGRGSVRRETRDEGI